MSNTVDINVNQYLSIFFAYKWIVIILVISALCVGGFVYSNSPKLYSSTVSINFEFFNPTNPLANAGGNFAITSNEQFYVQTQIDLIQSRLVAGQVYSGMTADQQDRLEAAIYYGRSFSSVYKELLFNWFSKFKGLFVSDVKQFEEELDVSEPLDVDVLTENGSDNTPWQAMAMLGGIKAESVFSSRIVNISYVSAAPELAAVVANAFASTYINTSMQLLRNPAEASKRWLSGQIGNLKAELEKAQSSLTQYKTAQGIVISAERVDLESTKLEKMSGELVSVVSDLRQAEVVSRQLKETKKEGKSLLSLTAISDNPQIQSIRNVIRELEGAVVQSSSDLGQNHPKLRQLRAELDEAKKKLARELGTVLNLIKNREKLLKKRHQSLSKSMQKQKDIVLSLQQQFDQINVFESEVSRRKEAYDSALGRINEAGLQSASEGAGANISIVDKARVSFAPVSPIFSKILLFSLVGAFCLSVFIVVMAEFFWRKIRSVEDVFQEFDLKVLGVLPR